MYIRISLLFFLPLDPLHEGADAPPQSCPQSAKMRLLALRGPPRSGPIGRADHKQYTLSMHTSGTPRRQGHATPGEAWFD